MKEQYLEYTKELPKKSRMAVNALGGQNGKRYAIVMLLSGEHSLSFTEIQNELEMQSQSLNNALNDLQRGGIIEKKIGGKIGKQSTGDYILTSYGEQLIQNIRLADPTESVTSDYSVPEEIGVEFLQEHLICDSDDNVDRPFILSKLDEYEFESSFVISDLGVELEKKPTDVTDQKTSELGPIDDPPMQDAPDPEEADDMLESARSSSNASKETGV